VNWDGGGGESACSRLAGIQSKPVAKHVTSPVIGVRVTPIDVITALRVRNVLTEKSESQITPESTFIRAGWLMNC
jgi:hypothetical protein